MDDNQDYLPRTMNFAVTAALFEGGLAVFAMSLGWAFGIQPVATFHWSWLDLGWGCLATLPPFGILALCLFLPWEPFQRIERILNQTLIPLFRECKLYEIAVIAFLAGLGEELLFRSIVQGGLAQWMGPNYGPVLGLIAAAIIFGLLHAITVTYAILAAIIGFYIGVLWLLTGNLLVPITAHALYDFFAILILLKTSKPRLPEPKEEELPNAKV